MELTKEQAQTFFVMGISFLGVSTVFITAVDKAVGFAFLGMGALWMVIGGARLRELEKKERKRIKRGKH